ncbi:MAG: HEPN domain-containing protein [Candidatus Aenigmarchaeota archaeon]|nr:HEPN domain-containing protein [Candidatus Aenigmarchaeota archaeon]
MIVTVDRWKGKGIYLVRAEQYSRSSEASFKNGDWDACVGNAVHCAISAQDAFCIQMKAQRYKGQDHREAAEFFSGLLQNEEHRKACQRLFTLIQTKTDAEYGDRQLKEKDAQQAKLDAERFLAYVKAFLG